MSVRKFCGTLCAVLCLFVLAPVSVHAQDNPDNFIIIEVFSDRILINSALEALYNRKTLLLPLSYIKDDLGVQLEYGPDVKFLTGWIENESNTVFVNFNNNTGRSGKNMFTFTNKDFLYYEDELFLSTRLIDKILNTHSIFDFSTQSLSVETSGNLPFEKKLSRRAKQQRFDRIQKQKKEAQDAARNKTAYMQKNWLQMPFFDLSARYNVSKPKDQPEDKNFGYSANASLLTGGFDSDFNIYSSTNKEDPIVALKTARVDEQGNILGIFKQIELGDIYSLANAENRSSGNGYGIKLSTEDPLQPTGKTYAIRDTLPLGWEVELYRNNELLAYQNHSEDGFFEFADIPLLLGKNTFKLIFYGPQGQIREKEDVVFFNGNILDKGKARVRADYIQKNRYLVETRDPPRRSSLGHNAMLEAGYGITNNLTLNLSAIADSLELYYQYPPEKSYRKDKAFAAGDLSLFTHGIYSSLGTVVDFEENAATLDYYIQTSLWNWDVTFENIYFGDAITSRNLLSGTYVRNETDFRLNKNLSFWLIRSLPISYSFRRLSTVIDENQTEHYLSVSQNLPFHTYLNVSYENARWISQNRTEQISGTLNHSYGKLTLRSGLTYDIVYHRTISVDASAFYDLTNVLRIGGKYTYLSHNMTKHSYESLYAASLNWKTKLGFISFEIGTSSWHNSYGFIGYNISFLPDMRNRNIYYSADKLHGTGALSALAFMDENSNGIRDPKETILKEANFTVAPAIPSRTTHHTRQGAQVITHLPAYRDLEVSADTSQVQETLSLLNTSGSQLIRVRPSQIAYIEFPIVGTGDLEGTVYINDKPANGILLNLYKDNMLVDKKVSEYDGFYSFPQLPLGQYTIQLDTAQANELHLLQLSKPGFSLDNYEQLEIKDIKVLELPEDVIPYLQDR